MTCILSADADLLPLPLGEVLAARPSACATAAALAPDAISCLGAFGRRPPERVVRSSLPAAENLRTTGLMHCSNQSSITLSASASRPVNGRGRYHRERIRANLDLDRLRARALAAFVVIERARACGRPQAAALPAGIGIVDASIDDILRKHAHRIGYTQRDEPRI